MKGQRRHRLGLLDVYAASSDALESQGASTLEDRQRHAIGAQLLRARIIVALRTIGRVRFVSDLDRPQALRQVQFGVARAFFSENIHHTRSLKHERSTLPTIRLHSLEIELWAGAAEQRLEERSVSGIAVRGRLALVRGGQPHHEENCDYGKYDEDNVFSAHKVDLEVFDPERTAARVLLVAS
jgi:hypothetical protein